MPAGGLLLALPALQQTGPLACACQVYGRLRDGYQSLDESWSTWCCRRCCASPRRGRHPRPAAGDRPGPGPGPRPEVKTIRRKISELAAAGKAVDLQMAVAQRRAQARPDELAIMYIDGHTRAYFGKRDVQKTHVARPKFLARDRGDLVTDGAGDPLLVVMAEPSSSLAAQIKELLPGLRQIAGQDARPTPRFDRGGWSWTVRRHHPRRVRLPPTARPAWQGHPGPAAGEFQHVTHTGDDGRARETSWPSPLSSWPSPKAAAKGRWSGCGRSPAWTRAGRSTS